MFKSYVSIFCSGALLALSACQNGGPGSDGNSENIRSADSNPSPAKTLMDQVDEHLSAFYMPSGIGGLNPRLYSLSQACFKAKGVMNQMNDECECKGLNLFTTAGDQPMCTPVAISPSGIHLEKPTGFYGDEESHRMIMVPDLTNLDFSSYQATSNIMTTEQAQKVPFRLSLYGFANYLVQIDPTAKESGTMKYLNSPKLATSDLYSVIQGQPFSGNNEAYPLYEPNSRAAMKALGLGTKLSNEDEADFRGVGSIQKMYWTDRPVAQGVIDAYRSLPTSSYRRVDEISSPYKSGCATYCISTMWLETPSSSDYRASYRKVYQFGTPSARLIVVQDKYDGELVAVISLNAEETISTINLIEKKSNPTLYSYRTFDRNWNYLYGRSEAPEETHGADSFENLLNVGS